VRAVGERAHEREMCLLVPAGPLDKACHGQYDGYERDRTGALHARDWSGVTSKRLAFRRGARYDAPRERREPMGMVTFRGRATRTTRGACPSRS
jgi:hypothetical protein